MSEGALPFIHSRGTNKKPFKCDRHFHPVSGLKELPPSKRGGGGGRVAVRVVGALHVLSGVNL